MRKAAWILIALVTSCTARSESFVDKLNDANAKLRNGESQAALDAYRELQIENPESDVLYHNLGCAQYSKGTDDAKSGAKTAGTEVFNEAKASFEKAQMSDSPAIRRSALFNRANSIAQQAISMDPAADQKAVAGAFEESIKSYEEILANDPGNKDAQTNLDHMRYLLKKMLQKPPEQDQQQPGEKEEQKEGEKKDQEEKQESGGEQQEQQPEKQDEQQQSKSESEEKKDQAEQQQEDQKQPDKPDQKEQQQSEQEAQDKENAAAQPEENQAAEAQAEDAPDAKDMQAVEALLQSLDDQDQREQMEMRRGTRDSRPKGDWW
ncbi:MAG: hypothetical protein WC655_12050 [Candidatus Hydrogenedentales bacterium]|jgi:Ca-activated chloride channel family protein